MILEENEYLIEFTTPFDPGSDVKQSQLCIIEKLELVEIPREYWNIFMAPSTSSIEFSIGDIRCDAPMKPIPLRELPYFHCLFSEDLGTFLFKFDVIYWEYDYIFYAQKLKIFLATLKGTTLRWLMGLGGKYITTWDDIKTIFLKSMKTTENHYRSRKKYLTLC